MTCWLVVGVAVDVHVDLVGDRIGHLLGQRRNVLLPQRRQDTGLVTLADFTTRQLELEPVAVGRDMAARYHNGRQSEP